MFAMAWRLARREMRGGLKGFRVLLACLALGVFAIAAAGSTRSAVEAGMEGDAQALLGGDIEARQTYRSLTDDQRAAFADHGTVSSLREMRAMARAGDQRALTELKAVDAAYPLYGAVVLDPAMPLAEALAQRDGTWGAVVEPSLANRLGITVGDSVRLGDATLQVRATIRGEPDRISAMFAFGPRTMIALPALADTGLVQPGSLIRDVTRLRIEDGSAAAALAKALEARFPDAGWRLRLVDQAAPGLERFLGNVTLFLTLVGLTALLTGGIGVANAVKAFVDGRVRTIATLKTLGASSGLVFRAYLMQIGLLALAGIVVGLVLGALAPLAVSAAAGDLLPVEAKFGIYPKPLLQAAGFGLLIALVFGLWPLARTLNIPAAALFRALPAEGRVWPGRGVGMVIALSAVALAVLTVASADRKGVAAGFVVGAILALALFRGMASLVMRLARRPRAHGRPALRLALANLHRPGAPTPSVVLSLGLGLSVLVAIALVEANLGRQIGERMPETAPAFYFIDIQGHQRDRFAEIVQGIGGADIIATADMVRGRVVALRGQPVDENSVDPDARWAVRGDRGLTTAAEKPADATVVAGEWWAADYSGPPLLSVAQNIAQGLGLNIGDTVTLNVLGREITGTIANLRDVDWSTLSMNFAFIVSPGILDAAPRTWIATVAATPAVEDRVEAAVVDEMSNVSAIRVRQALDAVQRILGAAGQAVRATAGVTLAAGALVLAGAVAAGHRRRIYDAVVLKVLGARRRDVLRAYLIEYGIMGAATGVIAAVVGTASAWAVLVLVMRADWVLMPGVIGSVVAACIVLTLAGGFLGTWRALAHKASPLLRNE